jgi:hypothetical protein
MTFTEKSVVGASPPFVNLNQESTMIDNFRAEAGTDHVLHGTTRMFGLLMHARAIRVELRDTRYILRASNPELLSTFKHLYAVDEDWQGELERLYGLVEPDGNFATTELPGFKGEWVIFTYPQTL